MLACAAIGLLLGTVFGTGVVIGGVNGPHKNNEIKGVVGIPEILESCNILLDNPSLGLPVGTCLSDDLVGVCDDFGPFLEFEGVLCDIFGLNVSTCVCPEGQLVQLETGAELCNRSFACPPVNLSIFTPRRTSTTCCCTVRQIWRHL